MGKKMEESTQTHQRLSYRRKEAAQMLGVSESLLRLWELAGKGPRFVRVDRVVLYPARDLAAWLVANAVDPTE